MSKPIAAAAASPAKAADKLKAHVDSHMQTKFAHIDEQKEKSVATTALFFAPARCNRPAEIRTARSRLQACMLVHPAHPVCRCISH